MYDRPFSTMSSVWESPAWVWAACGCARVGQHTPPVVILSGMAFQGEYPGMFRHHAFVGVLAFLCAIPGAGTPTSSVEAAGIAVTPATQQITQAINDNQLSLMADNVRPEVATAIDQGRVDDSTALDHMLLLLHLSLIHI